MDKVTPIDSPSKKKRVARRRATPSPSQHERWERANQAYELRISGKLPGEIAQIMGISHPDVLRMFTERFAYDASYLTEGERKSILGLELARLEALQTAVWPAAMMGDPKSVDSAVKIIQARAKISGLEKVDPVVQKSLVLVMGDKEEDYIAALKAVSDD